VQHLRRGLHSAQQVAQIGTIHAARDESRFCCRRTIEDVRGLALHPVNEMMRLILERAHAADRNVQQVVRVLCRIGQTHAELRVAINQCDTDGRRNLPLQL